MRCSLSGKYFLIFIYYVVRNVKSISTINEISPQIIKLATPGYNLY